MATAIITGGAGGMGLATARILGTDHRVVIADVDPERLDAAVADLERHDVEAIAVECDITDRDSVAALFAAASDRDDLRAVVHTAGVSPLMGAPSKIARINALGTVHVVEAALASAQPGLSVVNVASIAGHMLPKVMVPTRLFKLARTDRDAFIAKLERRVNRGPKRMRSGTAYSLSKAFVLWYTRAMAADFGAAGARIVSVSPGSFDTVMGRLEEQSGSGKLTEFAALKRFGTADEIAALLAFCASDKPGYLTGTDILCDGGTKAGLGLKGMLEMSRAS